MADGNYDALISGSELNERWRSMLTRYIKKQCGDDEELFKNIHIYINSYITIISKCSIYFESSRIN